MVLNKNYAEVTGEGVMNTLSDLTLSTGMVDYLKSKREMWTTFGKMNSHLYRKQLMEKMALKGLSPEAKMMIWAMSSVIKSQPRIIQAMEDTPEPDRFAAPGVWFAVKDFFQTECTQYVSAAKKNKKFPVVNIPTTMPGLDILMFCLTTVDEERTMDKLKIRPTFSQLLLQAEAQTIAKEGYQEFWTKIVRGSRNEDKVDKPAMREEFYENSAADSYMLVTVKADGSLEEVPPNMGNKGYSKEEIMDYLRSFDTQQIVSAEASGSA
jgi:hypothetical protein